MKPPTRFALLAAVAWSAAWGQTPVSAPPAAEQIEFFETRIRPVLAKNCYPCHSSATKVAMGGLRLDSREGVRRGGQTGAAVVPGKPDQSPMIRAVRHEGRQMPPSGKLPDAIIADLEKWVEMGAADPRESSPSAEWTRSAIDIEKGRRFWAFQTPVPPTTPAVHNRRWSARPIDRFLLAGMEKNKLQPSAEADRATWLRRVTYDLTGLPPTPAEIESFLKDRGLDAHAKVADRLLASERFGERWGRHWLDVARYAETVGRGRNYAFPFAWRYRDYVIDSFNHDKPYDRFLKEQIAGDLLPSAGDEQRNEQLTATGFLAIGSHDLIEINAAVFRMDVIDEQVNATTRAFLGLSVGCARCHDHKFDPIPTTDYYALAGIFQSTEMLSGLQRRPRDNISYFNAGLLARLSPTGGEAGAVHLADAAERERWDRLQTELAELGRPPLQGARKKQARPVAPAAELRQQATRILAELDKLPLPPDLVMAVHESDRPGDSRVHIKGDVQSLGPTVPRGFVEVLSRPGEAASIEANESGRLQLAEWLARADNPLTARVMVNRVWHQLFGRGLVRTVDNFGAMGDRPTHPELLDYLATRFIEQGWSVKKMIREIVLTRAYRMSTAHHARNARSDPDNLLFWRQNRRRLEVEAIRDSMLVVSGQIDFTRPEASPVLGYKRGFDVGRGQGTMPEDHSTTMRHRSVFVPVLRSFVPAMFETFDFPEPSETKGRRDVTTVPTQALFLMNSPWVLEQARLAAGKLLAAGGLGGAARVGIAFRQVLGRAPGPEEVKRALEFVSVSAEAETSSGDAENRERASWARLYQALFASAEFRYRS